MHRKMLLLGTALSLSFAATAAANERHGWYVGLEAGWVHVNDTEMPNWFYQEIQFENRWGALGTVGFAFNGNWRMELEVGYRNNDVHQITFGGERGPLIEGELSEWTGMLNALYNQPVGKRWSIDFGAGVGVDAARYTDIIDVPGVRSEDSDAVFAAQGILGLSYRVGPHWDVMLNYRYLWADEPQFTNFGGETDTMDMVKHTVTLGFRWGYDDVAPPPPPPPPPAPPPPPPPARAKQFIVFFGFDKCDITAEADTVLTEAASAAKAEGTAKVQIVGHTDTSGSPAYNQRLSECRSGAAKANLVGKGIADGAISTSGKGEGDLMVQTADGVKEPQNRRATVDLQ